MIKSAILATLSALLVITFATTCLAGETISIYPSATESQTARIEWSEKIFDKVSTGGFVDFYRSGKSFGKARVGYQISNTFSIMTETRFSSATPSTATWVGPQVKIPLGHGSATTFRYWMRDGKCPDLGTFTKIQLNKKWSIEATINYDLGSSKFTLVEPELVFSPNKDVGIGLRYSQTSKYSEIQLGVKFRI